jgi:polar amino acid transport system substrate-binding protein
MYSSLLFMESQTLFTAQPDHLNIVASDFDACPMSYLTPEGYRAGYEPELAREVCQYLGLTPVWHNLPMADFYTCFGSTPDRKSLYDKNPYDAVWFNQAITPERQQWVNFSRPYGLFDEAVLVRKDSKISSVADLSDCRVGGLADSTNIALVEGFPGAKAVPYPGSDRVLPEMLAALRSGEIDALIDDELVLQIAAEEDPNLVLAFSLPTQVPFAIGVSKDRPLLIEKLDAALSALLSDGRMEKLWTQWISWKPFPFS